jgi:hypothetical protein
MVAMDDNAAQLSLLESFFNRADMLCIIHSM